MHTLCTCLLRITMRKTQRRSVRERKKMAVVAGPSVKCNRSRAPSAVIFFAVCALHDSSELGLPSTHTAVPVDKCDLDNVDFKVHTA